MMSSRDVTARTCPGERDEDNRAWGLLDVVINSLRTLDKRHVTDRELIDVDHLA